MRWWGEDSNVLEIDYSARNACEAEANADYADEQAADLGFPISLHAETYGAYPCLRVQMLYLRAGVVSDTDRTVEAAVETWVDEVET